MDLFLAQDDARQRTGGLVSFLILVILGVIGVLHALGLLLSGGSFARAEDHFAVAPFTIPLAIMLLALGVIARIYALREGGASVALELGGERIHPGTTDPGGRRLVGLVEELSVAFGVPVPEIWLLPKEEAINAFVAGNDPSRAVIGVTKGALERLTREELQSVLAHEFSHIVCGEMRLNFQLLAWVQGILFLTLVGLGMIRSGLEESVPAKQPGGKSRSSTERAKTGAETLSVLGIVLVLLGSVSSFFGRILQASICRDREAFADSAASEFLGNSAPLVRALKKMGGMPSGSLLLSSSASHVGHLFFGEAAVGLFSWLFPTHPPLEERIRQLDPDWGGEFLRSEATPVALEPDEWTVSDPASAVQRQGTAVYRASALEKLGQGIGPANMTQAGLWMRALPEEWRKCTRSRLGARKLVLELCKPRSAAEMGLGSATPSQILLLLDLSMPLLRRLGPSDYWSLMRFCRREAHRGEEVDPFRYLLAYVLGRRLGIALGLREPMPAIWEEVSSVWEEFRVLISQMVLIASPTQSMRVIAYSNAWSVLGVNVDSLPEMFKEVTLAQISSALEACERAIPSLKGLLLSALGSAALYEGEIREREVVLLRLIGDAVGAPTPPLLKAVSV